MIKNGYQLCIDIYRGDEEKIPFLETVCLLTYEAADDVYRKLRPAIGYEQIGFELDFVIIHWVDNKIEESWVI